MTQDHAHQAEEIRSEDLTAENIAYYKHAGYSVAFIEDVMYYDLAQTIPNIQSPSEVSFYSWTPENVHQFFVAYQDSFQERSGFPGWSEAEWVHWTTSDPTFRPELSFVTIIENQALGFITSADDDPPSNNGYIIQLGVSHKWRGHGIGKALVIHTLREWQALGKDAVILHVNINNPNAIRLYQHLGFVKMKQRGKFVRA